MILADSFGVIPPDCKHTVYKKSNALFTSDINETFTVVGMPRPDDPLTAFALEMALKKGLNQDAFAKELGLADRQVVNNWKRRGMPARRHSSVAAILGLTVEQLLARKPLDGPREPAQAIYGLELSREAATFASEWQALRMPWKAQLQVFVQTLLTEQARDGRPIKAADVPDPLQRGERPRAAATNRK